MTLQEKRAYLSLYPLQQIKIERLRSLIFKNPDRRDIYKATLHRAERLRNEIEDAIDEIDNGLLTEILSQKYLCGVSLEDIADMLNYSKRQIERLHIIALEQLKL